MRRWGVVLLVAGLVLTGLQSARRANADDVITRAIHCTATLSHLVAANPNRIGMVVQNVGTIHANVGRGALGLTLHVGTSLSVTPGYTGGLECQTAGGTTVIEVYEEVE